MYLQGFHYITQIALHGETSHFSPAAGENVVVLRAVEDVKLALRLTLG